jgi:hypothetical protein
MLAQSVVLTGVFLQDCFYASVFEHQNPALRSLPLAVQQKQILVTCNYEARRRGLHKLQLIHEAKKVCPDVVIVLGEDLTRFRNASKELYAFLRSFSWNSRCERLGFDEVCFHFIMSQHRLPLLFDQVEHEPPARAVRLGNPHHRLSSDLFPPRVPPVWCQLLLRHDSLHSPVNSFFFSLPIF